MSAPPTVAQQLQGQAQSRASGNSNGTKRVEPPAEQSIHATLFKGPKRKRLIKACDPCHKSKRRCDGTAPCSNCYFASKDCTYTDSSGRPVPAPNSQRPDPINSQSDATQHNINEINISPSSVASGSYTPQLRGVGGSDTLHSQSQIQHRDAALPLGPRVPPASAYFDASGPFASQTDMLLEGSFRPRRIHGHNLLRGQPPPRKRVKDNHEVYERDDGYSSPTQVTLATSTATGVGTELSPMSSENTFLRSTSTTSTRGVYQRHIVRELVNLFFAHCHPHRLIIHSTSFLSDLCRDRVPSYLINSVCAVSASLSQNPLVRVSPVREAGQKFADAALAALFDSEGRLVTTSVEVAQALVLLQTYQIYKESNMSGDLSLFDLALRILHSQHVLSPNARPVELPPSSSDEEVSHAIQRESARRTFWLIHIIELLGATFTHRPTMYIKSDLDGVRLPCSEASFDLSMFAVPPEHLDSPALKTCEASEFGHVIRMATLLREIEIHNVEAPDAQAIANCENLLEQWVLSLSDHLKYSTENLHFQLSLWETSSNTSTWCYCFMHILHACAVLALSDIRKRLRQALCRDHQSALTAVPVIINALGPRARNSVLMGSVLWLQWCGPHASFVSTGHEETENDFSERSHVPASAERTPARMPNIPELLPQLDMWIKEWEEFWGPTHLHGNADGSGTSPEEHRNSTHSQQSPATSMIGTGLPNPEVQVPTHSATTWNVPNVVIDPVLRTQEERAPGSAPQASPALSSTSTLRGRDQPSLPSLKSSGLLDVFADEPLNRLSGASTPVKQAPSWSLAPPVSPRQPLLSPGLPVPVPGSSGSVLLSPQPNPLFGPGQGQHAPQLRLQAPDYYPHNSSLPNPGLAGVSPFQDEGPHGTRAMYGPGPTHAHARGHGHPQPYFEQTPSPLSPSGHMLSSHGGVPAARR
ncbi:hypothetical protein DFH11DRAFT_1616599 [Phellopilus nigrolimitatus]|nr:hypothetical protein DFH11DRAFT_1616599 [Phellopilus nigrolimitatus]